MGKRAYVSNSVSGTISVLDLYTLTKIADIDLGGITVNIVFTPNGKWAYVAARGTGGGRYEGQISNI